jgi:metal-responsive CopG/Arc/MetJ family transcriptional regulator
MPRVRHIDNSPIPIRLSPELLAEIEAFRKRFDLSTRSQAIRIILWEGVRANKEKTRDP